MFANSRACWSLRKRILHLSEREFCMQNSAILCSYKLVGRLTDLASVVVPSWENWLPLLFSTNPAFQRSVDSSTLAFSLASHRYSCVGLLCRFKYVSDWSQILDEISKSLMISPAIARGSDRSSYRQNCPGNGNEYRQEEEIDPRLDSTCWKNTHTTVVFCRFCRFCSTDERVQTNTPVNPLTGTGTSRWSGPPVQRAVRPFRWSGSPVNKHGHTFTQLILCSCTV
jgi:hypothetical protein